MSTSKWRYLAIVTPIAITLGLGIGIAVGSRAANAPSVGVPEGTNGLVDPSEIPDLIPAVGDHGIEGYIRRSDLETSPPANPSEALAQQSEPPRLIPIYADDNETIVDYLTEGETSPTPSPP